jgi:uncharacterized protein YgiM (DUF1202 family)
MKERFFKWILTVVIAGVFFYTLYAFYPERGFLLRDEKLADKEKKIAAKPKPVEETGVLEEESIAAKPKPVEETGVLEEESIAAKPKPVEETGVLEEESIAAKPKPVEETGVLEEPTVELMYVQKDSVRLRSGPGLNYVTIGSRNSGEKTFTRDLEGDWYRIVDPNDFNKTIGWIHRSLLGKMPPRP